MNSSREHVIVVTKDQRSRSGQTHYVRPTPFQTEESVVDGTIVDPVGSSAELQHALFTDGDRIVQLFAALNRFNIRLTRRVQFARREDAKPRVVRNTQLRLEDERAALSVVQAHAVLTLATARCREHHLANALERHSASDKNSLHHLHDVAARVTKNAQALVDAARSLLGRYTAMANNLVN